MEALVDDQGYAALLGTFGPSLIDVTGSRPTARQADGMVGAARIRHPRELRAIPNNAILQQLGWCANTLQGIGAAVLVPNSLALLSHAYPNETARGRAVGIWAAGASLTLTAGPLAGGVLIALVGWRSIFLVNLPIGLGALWLTWRYAHETPRSPQRELVYLGVS